VESGRRERGEEGKQECVERAKCVLTDRGSSCAFIMLSKWSCIALVCMLLLALLSPCLGACPSNCNHHGDCRHDVCSCSAGWSGSDCSLYDVELVSGESYSDSLDTFTWHYYHVNVGVGTSGLNVTVRQTSDYGDVDVYIQRGALPTQRSYLTSDTTTANYIELSVTNPGPGLYYVGLYGYWHVDYTLTVDVLSSCSVDCGAHGHCEQQTCICYDSYTGAACDKYDRTLTSGNSVSDHVETGEWKYYHLIVPDGNMLSVTLQGTPSGDVDLYLKHEDYPTFWSFDYLNGTIQPLSTLVLEDPQPGTWYIGCYGYRADSYTLTADVEEAGGCPGECSGESHGSCRGSRCRCEDGFEGEACEHMVTQMTLDTVYDGHVDQNMWNYYWFDVDTTNDVVVAVDQESTGQDCDIFVKSGQDPSRVSYEYAELSYREQFNVTIENPSGSTWHIGVYGWTECTYTMYITIPTTCVCRGDHGECRPNSGVCLCDPGWTGPYCDEGSLALDNGAVYVDQTVTQYNWAYYSITTDSSMVLISMKEQETQGFLWLFVSLSGFPELDGYEAVDRETNSDFHEVHLLFDTKERRDYYIGVYGNPFDVRGPDPVPFKITAWSPPF